MRYRQRIDLLPEVSEQLLQIPGVLNIVLIRALGTLASVPAS